MCACPRLKLCGYVQAPNGPSQQQVIRSALTQGEIEAKDIHVLEMHGTGTGLGDPIEVSDLFTMFDLVARPFNRRIPKHAALPRCTCSIVTFAPQM